MDEILFPFFLLNTIQLPLSGHFMLSAYEKQTAILIFVPTDQSTQYLLSTHDSFYKSLSVHQYEINVDETSVDG